MPEPSHSSGRFRLFRILTPIFAVLAVCLCFEAGLRIAGFNPLQAYLSSQGREFYIRESANPKLRHELNPGFQGKVGNCDIRINSAGLRGHEVETGRSDRVRIALLGDSIVFARQVAEAEIFPTLLENRLRRIRPDVDVLNLGVEGFDTLEEVEFLKDIGLKLHPDYVILFYSMNDIGMSLVDTDYQKRFMKPRIPLRYASRFWLWVELKIRRINLQKTLTQRIDSGLMIEEAYAGLFSPAEKDAFLKARFAEIDAAQAVFNRIKSNRRKAIMEKSGRLWLQEYKSLQNIGKIRYGLEELKKLAEAKSFRLLVGIIPYFYKIDGIYLDAPAHAIVRRETERLGLETVDFYEALNARGLETLSLDGVHLNVRGHKAMAEILEQILAPRLASGKADDSGRGK
ncbi:MAG: GDSL-type esterase/lipase family protein [Candidatus Aminicenantes bacterium]|nr:GDSL-type esterase/lipase family protein [Candidatus Aminicenantes bacterium]